MAITESAQPPQVLVAGCGKLGGSIASLFAGAARVYGLRRNPDKVPAGVHGIGADLLCPDTLATALPANLDLVIYCLTPSGYDEQGYRDAYVNGLNHLADALAGHALKRLIFISSTSVYSQNDDSQVDETSPANPARFSGQQILAGEQAALASGQPTTVIRFSGIYGPTRQRFLTEVIEGRMNPQSPAPFSNRIHEEDAANAVHYLGQRALAGQPLDNLYVASDCQPVRLDEVVAWVRRQTPCAPPVDEARTGGRAGSKQCNNQRLLATGFRFRYPDFRQGYQPIIDNRHRARKTKKAT
jgi:nucleoside-diphosphate-sugar epimerase